MYLWLYVYNIVRISSTEAGLIPDSKDSNIDAQEPLLLTSVDQLSSSSKSGVYLTSKLPNEACSGNSK